MHDRQIAGKSKLEVILKVTHLKRVESEPLRYARGDMYSMRREPWQWLRFAPWKKEDSKAKCIYRGPIQKIQQPEFLSLEVRNNNKSSGKWNCYWVCQSCNLYLKEGSFINDFKAGDSTQNSILVNLMYTNCNRIVIATRG